MELIITDIREENRDVKTFLLMPSDGSWLPYEAGQFLTFPIATPGNEQRRSYSLSSAPGIDALPAITVKRIENGLMSRMLIDKARPGDRLQCAGGASGLFTLPQTLNQIEAVWLFAAGIGITPIFSLLKKLMAQPGPQATLLYSNRDAGSTVFLGLLRALGQTYSSRLRVIHLWSSAKDLRRARLSKESFPILREAYLHSDPAKTLCYICGPGPYMWLLRLLLQDAGVPASQVRQEMFMVTNDLPRRLPLDKGNHRINVRIGAQHFSFLNAYPDSILSSAKAAGITLPYSCEAGQCGSCTAICTAGKVWMSYDEVLTDRDIDAGRVLTCTGHAVDGDVTLHY